MRAPEVASLHTQRALLAHALAESRVQGSELLAHKKRHAGPAGAWHLLNHAHRWWRNGSAQAWHVLRALRQIPAGQLLDQGRHSADILLRPSAARHPWVLLGTAAGAGALLVLSRPQRLARWAALWLLPQVGIEANALFRASLRSWLRQAMTAAPSQPQSPGSAPPSGPGPEPLPPSPS